MVIPRSAKNVWFEPRQGMCGTKTWWRKITLESQNFETLSTLLRRAEVPRKELKYQSQSE